MIEPVAYGQEALASQVLTAVLVQDPSPAPVLIQIISGGWNSLAATAMEVAFLFDNLDRCCLHAAPSFGDIGPGEASTTVSRLYLARGTLDDFLQRMEADRVALAARQRWARPARSAQTAKPHGRMERMAPDELEQVLDQAPVAFVPLGTYEHHGWHLPIGLDGIKAHGLCWRVAQRTGGAVLPTFFHGTGGGHIGYIL